MGKSLIIKGADFSNSAIGTVVVLDNLVNGFLSGTDGSVDVVIPESLLCVTSEDYINLSKTKYIYYNNSTHEAAICLYDANKDFIKRLLITTKEATPSSVDITQISGYDINASYARIAVANEIGEGNTQLTIEEMQGNILASDTPL